MIRLLQLEWFKLRHYRPFWILIGMYFAFSILVCSGLMIFMNYLKNEGADFKGFDPTMLPLYDFPDIWQNLSFIAALIKVILAFIIIMSIYNELNHRIVRQHIIDGLSKKEWIGSKLIFIGFIAFIATLILFLNGLILGFIYAHPDSLAKIFENLQFLLVYFLDVFVYLTFAMMLILLIRKSGLVIVGLLMYTIMFEPMISGILYNAPDFPDYARIIPDFFPVQALRNLIPFPFKRYVFMEVQDYVSIRALIIALGWLVFNIGMSYFLLTKRDI